MAKSLFQDLVRLETLIPRNLENFYLFYLQNFLFKQKYIVLIVLSSVRTLIFSTEARNSYEPVILLEADFKGLFWSEHIWSFNESKNKID